MTTTISREPHLRRMGQSGGATKQAQEAPPQASGLILIDSSNRDAPSKLQDLLPHDVRERGMLFHWSPGPRDSGVIGRSIDLHSVRGGATERR